MGRLIFPIGFLLLMAALAIGSCAPPSPSTLDYAREDAQLAQLAREEASEAYWQPIRAAVLNVAGLATVIAAIAGASAWGSLALIRFRHERMPRRGDALLPVRALDLPTTAPAALGAWHGAAQLAASHAPVPQSLTYAPHFSNRADITGASGDAPALPAPGGVPTFAQLLTSGRVGRGQPLMLGVNLADGKPVEGSWLDVYSSAMAGQPNSGKTTTQRFLAAQLALWGARFVVCDPHAEAGDDSLGATLEPLRSIYLCDPAIDPGGILEAVRLIDHVGSQRVHGDRDRSPVVLWVDELNGLLQDATVGPPLLALLQETTRAYRKVNVFISAVAHTWNASSTGGSTDLRANFASRLVHRTERQAARQLVPTDLAARVERLEQGQAVLHSMRYSTVVAIPLTTAADIASVAQQLATPSAAPSAAPSAPRPIGFRPEGRPEGATEGATAAPLPARQEALTWTPEEAAIVAALAGGKKPGELAEEMSGKKGGREYLAAAARIAAVINRLARGGAR